ncbi:MAG TPA: hypothetical protein VGG06_04170 [Thermoanaerobaculia bacterium]|jgi:hypothetical protein
MRTNRIALIGAVALAAGLVMPVVVPLHGTVAAAGQPSRKALKNADTYWNNGRTEAALEIYESVLAATEPGAPERAGALFAVAVAAFAAESGHYDPLRGRELLAELVASYRLHPRRLEILAFESLAAAADRAAARASELERQRLELRAAAAATGESHDTLAAKAETLAEKLAAAERRLAAQGAELAAVKEELARKEEALAKLTERVVGRAGDG